MSKNTGKMPVQIAKAGTLWRTNEIEKFEKYDVKARFGIHLSIAQFN